jgi:hypothetical protein
MTCEPQTTALNTNGVGGGSWREAWSSEPFQVCPSGHGGAEAFHLSFPDGGLALHQWFAGETNDVQVDVIDTHESGHASNGEAHVHARGGGGNVTRCNCFSVRWPVTGEELMFQTARSTRDGGGALLFQIVSNKNWTSDVALEFTFLRLL